MFDSAGNLTRDALYSTVKNTLAMGRDDSDAIFAQIQSGDQPFIKISKYIARCPINKIPLKLINEIFQKVILLHICVNDQNMHMHSYQRIKLTSKRQNMSKLLCEQCEYQYIKHNFSTHSSRYASIWQ